jgi:hypothetical protein
MNVAGHHALGTRTGSEASETAGVEGNARLTAVNGIILIVLLFVEGITILQIRGLITLHVFLGLMLVGPVTLKCGSTIYRFARYYGHRPAYVHRGPPAFPLRVLGPLVIVSTVAVIGTGIGLLAYRPGNAGRLLTAHKASFIVWVALMTIHVLAHLREAAVTSGRELRPPPDEPARRSRASRTLALVGALVIGVGIAAAVTPTASAWVGYRTHSGR